MAPSTRNVLRRIVVIGFVVLQLGFVVRAYWAPHKEFGYQMFPEASQWQAEIVRVTETGDRVPVSDPWYGYEWNELVPGRGLANPWRRHHADSGLDRQLAFLDEALDWVAANTPRDRETVYLEAEVTTWFNTREPETVVMRSSPRRAP